MMYLAFKAKQRNLFLFLILMLAITLIVWIRIPKRKPLIYDKKCNDEFTSNHNKFEKHKFNTINENYFNEEETFVSVTETYLPTSAVRALKKSKYIIDTTGCRITNFDKFDKEVMSWYRNLTGKTFYCTEKVDIKAFRSADNRIIVEWKNGSDASVPNCYYSEIKRKSENVIIYFEEKLFTDSRNFNKTFDNEVAVRVKCYDSESRNKTVFRKSIPMIPKISDTNSEPNDVPNVLLLGIDSASRLNFERHCTKTVNILRQKKFYQLYGYTRLAENTIPNMVPFYTGHYARELYNESNADEYFDDWPLIWKEFKKLGHVTMYSEVWPEAGTFTYLKPGFKKPPTDVYLRPWSVSISTGVYDSESVNGRESNTYCYGDEKEITHYYRYTEDFIKTMIARRRKYFSVVFMGRMSHDYLNNMHYMDDPVSQFLDSLFDQQLLNNTIVILFGDHGLRYGQYVWKTKIGRTESRLPMVHIYLPQGYMEESRNNLVINEHRLSTAFDIHATLMHIARQESPNDLIRGISLFDEIPETRSCEEASIDPQWCVCEHRISGVKKPLRRILKQLFVDSINEVLDEVSDLCHELSIKRVISIYKRAIDGSLVGNNTIYFLIAMVSPSNAVYEMMARKKSDNNVLIENSVPEESDYELVGEIIRLDSYRNQSFCIKNKAKLKYFCYCKRY